MADLALARAGASFSAEVAVMGLPTIVVPYPYATNGHQATNAKVFFERRCAVMIKDTLNGERLLRMVQALLIIRFVWNACRQERIFWLNHCCCGCADVAYSIAKINSLAVNGKQTTFHRHRWHRYECYP